METLALASEYIQNRFSIFPLRPRTKMPLLTSWEPYKTRYALNEQLQEWFSNGHAENNVAIVTGKISRIFAFDIDGEEASSHFNKILGSLDDDELKIALRHSLCIKTGSGNTNIVIGFREEEFASADDKITNSVLWRGENEETNHNEIRVKGEGGYIVAPPSIHTSGNIYEIINGSIATLPALSKTQINKLFSAIRNQAGKHTTEQGKKFNLNEEDVSDIVAILRPYYQHGNRNDLVMYLSGWMRKDGIAFQSALKVIEGIAEDDEEKAARIRTLEETYKKQDLHNVSGYSGLLSILMIQTQNEDNAKQILEQVALLFPKPQNGKQVKGASFGEEQKSEPQILLELAHANVSRFFKDQHGIAFALIVQKEQIQKISGQALLR
jgi:hypothetical protein